MTYIIKDERRVFKIYDTRKKMLYWMNNPEHLRKIVDLLNQKDTERPEGEEAQDKATQPS